jgi:hypothetical protein
MKIRLVLSTTSPKKRSPIELKLNVPQSKQKGFNNFVKAAKDGKVIVSFESETTDPTEGKPVVTKGKVQGEFYFTPVDTLKKHEQKATKSE